MSTASRPCRAGTVTTSQQPGGPSEGLPDGLSDGVRGSLFRLVTIPASTFRLHHTRGSTRRTVMGYGETQ
ncbi:hypothetical protein DIZ27_25705 [Streptomyces sp. NWU339]|nr:hypothetical protein DIZ27_25705 [Streptomyces sp. NWU339]